MTVCHHLNDQYSITSISTLSENIELETYDMIATLAKQVLKKDLMHIKKYQSDYLTRIICNFSSMVTNLYLFSYLDSLFSVITCIILILIMFYKQAWLIIFPVCLNLMILIILIFLKRVVKKTNMKRLETLQSFLTVFTTYITKLKAVVSRNKQNETHDVLELLSSDFMKKDKNYYIIKSFIQSLSLASDWFIQLITLVLGVDYLMHHMMTFYTLQLIFSYTPTINHSFNMIYQSQMFYHEVYNYYKKIQEIFEGQDTREKGHKEEITEVKIVNGNFSFNDQLILNNFNYCFKKNHIYQITGKNGQGKSTLFNIITGMYPLNDGKILLNNRDLNGFSLTYYQQKEISILCQDDLIFEGTLLSNLFVSESQEVKDLCFIFNLPKLDYIIDCNGSNLSIGQKRKILFLRFYFDVLKNNPSIILLDEPYYGIDQNSVKIMEKLIKQLSKERITLMINHDSMMGIEVPLKR